MQKEKIVKFHPSPGTCLARVAYQRLATVGRAEACNAVRKSV